MPCTEAPRGLGVVAGAASGDRAVWFWGFRFTPYLTCPRRMMLGGARPEEPGLLLWDPRTRRSLPPVSFGEHEAMCVRSAGVGICRCVWKAQELFPPWEEARGPQETQRNPEEILPSVGFRLVSSLRSENSAGKTPDARPLSTQQLPHQCYSFICNYFNPLPALRRHSGRVRTVCIYGL